MNLIRSKWPDVRIIVRGDSGFCRDDIMSWCEDNGVDYLFGMAGKGTCETIRLKLLKIGAQVNISVRRVHVRLASGYPYQQTFYKILSNLKRAYPQLC